MGRNIEPCAWDKRSWTVDERLSGVSKWKKVTSIITVVFYTGEDAWDGPRSVHDMMDIDKRVRQFVPDYPLYVIDMGHEAGFQFKKLDNVYMPHSEINTRCGAYKHYDFLDSQ